MDTTRTVALATGMDGGCANSGQTSYVADDVPGVAGSTITLPSSTSFQLQRGSTAGPAVIAWLVAQTSGAASTGSTGAAGAWTSGTVVLTDDDGGTGPTTGTALFTVTGVRSGDTGARCSVVRSIGPRRQGPAPDRRRDEHQRPRGFAAPDRAPASSAPTASTTCSTSTRPTPSSPRRRRRRPSGRAAPT